jgi:hypothetical protein
MRNCLRPCVQALNSAVEQMNLSSSRMSTGTAKHAHHDAGWIAPRDGELHLARKAAVRASVGQGSVFDRPASAAKFIGEMAHRGEYQRDLLLVVAYIGRLVPHLAHENGVERFVGGPQRGDGLRKLVAEDKDQLARHTAPPP